MTHDRLILVLGPPSGGTSAVAGVLHHLGVDMGVDASLRSKSRGYPVFEDRRVRKHYTRTDTLAIGSVAQDIARQEHPLRDFRRYCEDRLRAAKGKPCGVKIGSTVWLGDPDPASLPIRIVRVTRPLEDSIRSNWQYGKQSGEDAIRRAMQVAGYWACCEELVRQHSPHGHIEVDYYELLREPGMAVQSLIYLLNLEPSGEDAAREFIDPEKRHV